MAPPNGTARRSELTASIREDTRALMRQSGFAEYYDPISGQGLGGDTFSWTGATALSWATL